jgi:hypothetical protein
MDQSLGPKAFDNRFRPDLSMCGHPVGRLKIGKCSSADVSEQVVLGPCLSLTLPLEAQEVDRMTDSLRTVAHVKVLPRRAIISLIGNVQRSSLILEKVSQDKSRAGDI